MNLNVGSVIAHLQLNAKPFVDDLKKVQTRFRKVFSDMPRYAKWAVQKVTRVFSNMARTISKWTKRALVATTAYLAASAKAFSSFEDAMVRSAAVTAKATGSMRAEMERTALQISKKSILSATELAEGYFALGQAGFTAAQSIKALPVVQDFAIASQVKLDTATRYLVRTLEGLGMASENPIRNMQEMEKVSNSFTYAAIKTTAEIRDFAVAMTHAAAPALRLVNKSMEEGTAVLMAFARAGIVAEEAGTLLWTTVRDLQRANIKARGEWEKLGIRVYDTTGKMRNLADIFGDLENKFSGMSDEAKKVSLQLLGFQDRSLRGIQALMGFSDQMKKFQGDMENLSKLTRDIAEKYMRSFKAAMLMVWHQIVDVSIAVGKRLAPALRGLAKDFEDNQKMIKEWAINFADHIADAINAVRKFVRYVRYDMEGGIQLGLDIVKVLFKKFGESLMLVMEEIFVKLGANVLVWFQRGFAKRLELNKVSDEMINKAMGVKSSWERYFKLLMMNKEDFEKYTKDVEIAQQKAMERLSTGYFKQVSEEAYPTISLDFDILEGSLKRVVDEATAEINSLIKNSTWTDFTQTMPEIKEQWSSLFTDLKRDTSQYYEYATDLASKHVANVKQQLKTLDVANIFFKATEKKVKSDTDYSVDRWGDFITDTINLTERWKDVQIGAFNEVGDALTDVTMGIEADWKEVGRSIIKEINRMLIKFAMAEALSGVGLGGLVSGGGGSAKAAMGKVFSSGRVIPMAMGGIIPAPMLLPMGRSKTAYVGEAGPEAVMPLARTATGQLGVKAEQPKIDLVNKTKIVNVYDKEEALAAMQSEKGERVIMNILRRRGIV
jgi:TP901 family phage tail tape measure protein